MLAFTKLLALVASSFVLAYGADPKPPYEHIQTFLSALDREVVKQKKAAGVDKGLDTTDWTQVFLDRSERCFREDKERAEKEKKNHVDEQATLLENCLRDAAAEFAIRFGALAYPKENFSLCGKHAP